jgi:beta-glucosidase
MPRGGASSNQVEHGSGSERVVPEGFFFGVAVSGYQVEGGLNGPGEPANNWVGWERAARVEPSGIAVRFFERPEELLDRAAAIGLNMFRLGLEWARIEPIEGQIDKEALRRYAEILDGCRERGMEPLVTLLHFTHPSWLGEEFWLDADAPGRFAEFVELAVGELASRCRYWVTLNEINILGPGSYLFGVFPPGRRGAVLDAARAVDHLLAAHVKAYEVIHRLQPDAVVTTNNASASGYELDRLLIDLLVARSLGVERDRIDEWVAERRQRWYEELPPPSPLERLLRRLLAARSPIAPVGRSAKAASRPRPEAALDAIYSSPHERCLDVVAIDYYDPIMSHHLRLPGHRTAGGRNWAPARPLWDDPPNPEGLVTYLRANVVDGLPIWVAENGMAVRVRRGRAYPRIDGWDRPRYLRENIAAAVAAIDAGIPLGAYLHWSIVDNYEWGSYQPRFGIHGVDRDRGVRILDTDALGADAAGTYARIVAGLRAGDRSVLRAPS